ncbi:MAG: hypothetical protein K6C10_00555 [Prevotella sp.]|nr:hypothetical protein [Prevotella sp.]
MSDPRKVIKQFAKSKILSAAGCCTLLIAASCSSRHLAVADLLFHVNPEGNAITEVTPGMIDHVAIYIGKQQVLEAVGKGVMITPLDSLRQQSGYYLIGRTKAQAKRSVANARNYLGRNYDYLYLPDNDDIYCSELVQFSYVDRNGQQLFSPIPMSFHDSTGVVTDYWKAFYAERGLQVPEGKPGTNPGELSQRPTVKIIGKLSSIVGSKKFEPNK